MIKEVSSAFIPIPLGMQSYVLIFGKIWVHDEWKVCSRTDLEE